MAVARKSLCGPLKPASKNTTSTSTSTSTSLGQPTPVPGQVSDPETAPHVVVRELVDESVIDRLLRSSRLRNLKNDDGGNMHQAYCRVLNLAKHLGGYIPVRYQTPASGYGRYTSRVAVDDGQGYMPSLTTMKREVRALLATRFYHDVDFVNCHPVILEQLLEQHGIPCTRLSHYVAERESCVAEVMAVCSVSRDAAKLLFIRLAYLGSVEAWMAEEGATASPPHSVLLLRDELRDSGERLVGRPELDGIRGTHVRVRLSSRSSSVAPVRPMTNHTISSIVSIYLQTLERRCLDALRDAIARDGYETGALIYDGLHVLKDAELDVEGSVPTATLKNWRKHVMCVAGYDLELKVKPLEVDASWLEGDAAGEAAVHHDAKWDESWMDGSSIMSYTAMKEVWERHAFKVVVCGDYVRQEPEKHAVYTRGKLIDAYEHLKTTCVRFDADGAGEVKKSGFIRAWVADENLRKYKYMDLYPPPLSCPPQVFNMWTGFAVSKYVPPPGAPAINCDSPGVRAFVNHLHVLLGRNQACTDYVLDWVAQLFQQPSLKTGIALLLYGRAEGAGKNRWTDLLKLMLGDGLFLETANPGSVLFGRFTDARRGRFLVVVNEASGADNFAASDLLKDMITSETFVWEAKGRDGVQMRAYDRFIFTTNNANCLKINPDSRRYVVFEVSSELKGDTAYFKELSAHIADEHARHEFYALLMARDVSGVDWINHRPITTFYDQMVQLNLQREYEFLRDAVIVPAYMERVATVEMSASDMFAAFQQWLLRATTHAAGGDSSRSYSTNSMKFGCTLTSLVHGSDAMPGISKPLRRSFKAYAFQVDVVVAEMVKRKWLRQDELPMRDSLFQTEADDDIVYTG